MANSNLPQDMLLEIFLLLPAKSVGKCRCLSKTWRTLLSTKHFINLHLKTQYLKQEQKLFLVNKQSSSLHIATLPLNNEHEVIQPLTDISFRNNTWAYVPGSCNGLVLLLDKKYLFLANPVTRQQVKIPYPHPGSVHVYGFGYDMSSDDYKVVTISWTDTWTEERREKRYGFVDVYSLKTSVWKRIYNAEAPFDYSGMCTSNFSMPLVHGAVHCALVHNHEIYNILAFDLDNETFRQVQLPTELKMKKYFYSLVVLQGCLSIVHLFADMSTDIWMMKNYGVRDSWVRIHINANVMGKRVTPICFVGKEKILCVEAYEGNSWLICDLRDQGMVKTMAEGRIPFTLYVWGCRMFVESLVSPVQVAVPSYSLQY